MNDDIANVLDFIEAITEAQEANRAECECPLCCGVVHLSVSPLNQHLFAKYKKCGMALRE